MKEDEPSEAHSWLQEGKAVLDENSGCWIWQGYKDKRGYGALWFRGKPVRAHRLAAGLLNHPKEVVTRHLCHNPSCVNPDHLIGGSHKDNSRDSRGRKVKYGLCECGRATDLLSNTCPLCRKGRPPPKHGYCERNCGRARGNRSPLCKRCYYEANPTKYKQIQERSQARYKKARLNMYNNKGHAS